MNRVKQIQYIDLSSRKRKGDVDKFVKELQEFSRNSYEECRFLCFEPKEGLNGYWKFYLENKEGRLMVRVKFIGDFFYSALYM